VTPSFGDLARDAARRFVAAGIDDAEARLDAVLLARHVLGWDTATWIVRERERADNRAIVAFETLVARRVAREPVGYLLGVVEFWGLSFEVTPDTLIPRPETELLVERALAAAKRMENPVIIDVGTGSGCVAIAIARERRDARLIATDISGAAIEVARRNAARLGVESRIVFRRTTGLGDGANLVVSNPPYVASGDRLPPEVRDYEPHSALFAGADGLDVIRSLVSEARERLDGGARLLFEFGAGQAAAVRGLLAPPHWSDVQLVDDLQGIPRVAQASRSG
jgi:release factor glutamine methyltransferase